jgi:hypothetical protein
LTFDFAEVFEEKKMKANFSAGFTAWAARPSVFAGGLGYQEFWALGFGFVSLFGRWRI